MEALRRFANKKRMRENRQRIRREEHVAAVNLTKQQRGKRRGERTTDIDEMEANVVQFLATGLPAQQGGAASQGERAASQQRFAED